MPEMHPVASSLIAAVGYDPATRELRVTLRDPPRTYLYYPVARAVFEAFLRAPSKGNYFTQSVKGKYIYRPLDEETT